MKLQTLFTSMFLLCSILVNSQWATNGSGDAYNNNSSGTVGIGTSSPNQIFKLDVNGAVNITGQAIIGSIGSNSTAAPAELLIYYNGNSAYAGKGIMLKNTWTGSIVRLHTINYGLYLTKDDGSPAALTLGTRINPIDGSEFRADYGRWEIRSGSFSVNRDWTGIAQFEMTVATADRKGMIIKAAPSQTANLQEWQDASGTAISIINKDGNVGIGTTNIPTGGYKLAVGGNIIAERVRVKLQSSGWPDYVFSNTYSLLSLEEIEKYIKQNQCLPGVPSAAQTEKEGLDLGDGQAVLLKKIEELTLYLIDMNKKLDALAAENEALKKRIGN